MSGPLPKVGAKEKSRYFSKRIFSALLQILSSKALALAFKWIFYRFSAVSRSDLALLQGSHIPLLLSWSADSLKKQALSPKYVEKAEIDPIS